MVRFISNTGVALADIAGAFPAALEYELSDVARFTVILKKAVEPRECGVQPLFARV